PNREGTVYQQNLQSSRQNSQPSTQIDRSCLSLGNQPFRLKLSRCCLSASIKRRRGWMDGRVNTGELSINVVTTGKPKMLTGLSQKGTGAGTGSKTYPVMDTQRFRRTEST